MVWKVTDPQGGESAKVKYDIVQYTRGVVLDLGCGPAKTFPHFVGIDSGKDTELFGIQMKPDLVVDDCADLSGTIEDASCDAVFSSHLLEHIEDYKAALKDWWRCIKVGGHLALYLPHKAFYPNVGQPGANQITSMILSRPTSLMRCADCWPAARPRWRARCWPWNTPPNAAR